VFQETLAGCPACLCPPQAGAGKCKCGDREVEGLCVRPLKGGRRPLLEYGESRSTSFNFFLLAVLAPLPCFT